MAHSSKLRAGCSDTDHAGPFVLRLDESICVGCADHTGQLDREYEVEFSTELQRLGGPPGTSGEQKRFVQLARDMGKAPAAAASEFLDLLS